ncbi:MAG: hypothetical protein EXS10_04965 [Phycisphaerales bacterium]|nr:hypothetical protein [Phycisphaerales bacterium]
MKIAQNFALVGLVAASIAGAASATFTSYSAVSGGSQGGLTKYVVYANFNGPTDTALNFFHINNESNAGFSAGFYHADALNGGMSSNTVGTWNPQFVLDSAAWDSFLCVGGGTGFSSGNATNADPSFGTAGFNQAQIPFPSPNNHTIGPGWFNSNPPNIQGRVNGAGQVRLGQFVIADAASITMFLKVGYNNGVAGAPVQFAEGTFTLGQIPAPGAVALLGLAGLVGRRRRA